MKTVRSILISMNLCNYIHVIVRDSDGMPLGGGSVASVLHRFGKREVLSSCVIENKLVIHVGGDIDEL